MSEQRSGNTLLLIIAVTAGFLLFSFFSPFSDRNQRLAEEQSTASEVSEVAEPETLSDALEPLTEKLKDVNEDMEAINDDMAQQAAERRAAHEGEDAVLRAELEQYRAQEVATKTAPRPSQGSGGWTPPCPDGCDVGGAPRNVPQGVLIPWRDKAYKTTRQNLRVNRNRAGVGRIERNEQCSQLVEANLLDNYPERKLYALPGQGWIRTEGRKSVTASARGIPLSPLDRASKLVRIPCR